jgi:hypothetical protein
MIPMQTILALLAVLFAISGCAQRLPPIPGGRSNAAMATGNNAVTSPSPNGNSGNQPVDSTAQSKDNGAGLVLEQNGAIDFQLHLRGPDATTLNQMLAIKAVDGVKQGIQFKCTHDEKASTDQCDIKVSTADGSVSEIVPAAQVQKATPEKDHPADFSMTYLTLDTTAKGDGGAVRLTILFDYAKTIYTGMTVAPKVEGNDSRKNGHNIACDQITDSAKTTYQCFLYLHTDGLIETIVVP